MKLATVNRELDEIVYRLDAIRNNECAVLHEEKRSIECKIRDLKKEAFALNLRQSVDSKSSVEVKEAYLKPIQDKLDEIDKRINM